MASSTIFTQRPAAVQPSVRRATGRQQRLNVRAFGASPAAPENRQRATAIESHNAALQMPGPTGRELGNWIGMLDIFFSKERNRSLVEVSDFNDEQEDDDHASHMYQSHLANRMAMEPLNGRDH